MTRSWATCGCHGTRSSPAAAEVFRRRFDVGSRGRPVHGADIFLRTRVRGRRAYVTNETSAYPFAFTVLDVSYPTSPQVWRSADHAAGRPHRCSRHALALASQFTASLYDFRPGAPAPLSSIFALNATAHDIHVRDGRLFGSYMALSSGQSAELVVAGVSDPAHPVVAARVHYPGAVLTHSSWLTGNGQILYVTDEMVNAPIQIFDVSDFSRPVRIGTYQPRLGTIPHHFPSGMVASHTSRTTARCRGRSTCPIRCIPDSSASTTPILEPMPT